MLNFLLRLGASGPGMPNEIELSLSAWPDGWTWRQTSYSNDSTVGRVTTLFPLAVNGPVLSVARLYPRTISLTAARVGDASTVAQDAGSD